MASDNRHHNDDATKLKVIAATGEGLLRTVESLMMTAYNIYDVGRAIPHPYNAIGEIGSKQLHDMRGFASTLQSYINLVKSELDEPSDG